MSSPSSPPAESSSGGIRFDKAYIRTVPGILKIVQLLANIIGYICIKVSWVWVSGIFYNIVYWVGIIVTLGLFLAYMFHIVEKFDNIPWLKFEFIYSGVMAIAYIVVPIVGSALAESAGTVVWIFGVIATLAYAYDGFLKYKLWKSGMPAQ